MISTLLQTELPKLLTILDIPPFREVSRQRVDEVFRRNLATLGGLASDSLTNVNSPSYRQVLQSLQQVVEQQAAAGWERLSLMIRGRARVQVCLMDIPRRAELPEDLAQTALTRAHKSRHQFRGNSEAEYYAWVKSILDHLVIDYWRGLRAGRGAALRVRSVEEQCELWSTQGGLNLEDSSLPSPSELSRRRESVDLLFEAIERLPAEERCIVAEKLAERTFEQIARDTGIPKTTVVRRYHSALATLRRELEDLK